MKLGPSGSLADVAEALRSFMSTLMSTLRAQSQTGDSGQGPSDGGKTTSDESALQASFDIPDASARGAVVNTVA